MRALDILRLKLRTLLRRNRLDRELEEELQYHLDRQIQQNLDAGMRPEEARIAARRAIGGTAQIQEQCREARGVASMAGLLRDLGYGWRSFRREPVFAAAVVATLALGMGVNTAVFRIADALLLRGLPLPEPERLFQVLQPDGPGLQQYGELFAAADFREMREAAARYAQIAAEAESGQVAASLEGAPEELLRRVSVTDNYFPMLGVQPAIGRTFSPADEGAAVISYGLWKRRFDLDSRIVGRTVRMGKSIYQIIGVAQAGFAGLETGSAADVWTMLGAQAPRARTLRLIGRLLPGAGVQQAAGPMGAVFHRHMVEMVGHAPPGTPRPLIDRILQLQLKLVSAGRGISPLRAGASAPLWIVFGLVGLVLLLACATVATLFEARRSARRHEMAVRLSLGASRWRLMRQLLCEGLPIAAAAAMAGLILAAATAPVLVSRLTPAGAPIQLPSGFDGHVLLFTAALAMLTALLIGVVPAWHSSAVNPGAALKGGAARTGGRARTGQAMVAFQVAVSLILVMGATLFVRTLIHLSTVSTGFDRQNVVVASIQFRGAERGERLAMAWEDLRRLAAAIPGVESASLASGSAFSGAYGNGMLRLPDVPVDTRNSGCVFFSASTGFFRTSGIRLVRGRDFEARDFGPGAAPVAVVSESLARNFFRDANPIGRNFSNFEDNPPRWISVIGVAQDTRFENLRNPPARVVYLPYTWPHPSPVLSLVLRARRDAGALGAAVRHEANGASPDFTVRQITTQTKLIDDTLVRERLLAAVASFFGVLALLMAAVGLYGITMFTVAQRTPEIGIRMALGAARGAVVGMILRESAAVVGAGAAVGIAVSLAAERLVGALLFGARAYDIATLATAIAFVLGVTAAAALIPARRAARTDPMAALRYE